MLQLIMMPIAEVLGRRLSAAELEHEHRIRHHAIAKLREEMRLIYAQIEPLHAAQNAAHAGPAHLAQGIGFQLKGKV